MAGVARDQVVEHHLQADDHREGDHDDQDDEGGRPQPARQLARRDRARNAGRSCRRRSGATVIRTSWRITLPASKGRDLARRRRARNQGTAQLSSKRDGEDGDEAGQGGQHHRQRDIAAADEGQRVGGRAGRADRDDEQAERQFRRQAERASRCARPSSGQQRADGCRSRRRPAADCARPGRNRAAPASGRG